MRRAGCRLENRLSKSFNKIHQKAIQKMKTNTTIAHPYDKLQVGGIVNLNGYPKNRSMICQIELLFSNKANPRKWIRNLLVLMTLKAGK